MKIIGSNLDDAIEIEKANFVERLEYERKHNPSALIRKKREVLEEKKAELQRKKEIIHDTLKGMQRGEEILQIIDSIYELCEKEEKKKNDFLKLVGREEYSEMEFDEILLARWDDNPSFALVIQIFCIYYKFSIKRNNIEKILGFDRCCAEPYVCGKVIETLENFNKGVVSNEILLVLAALLYVVNSENKDRKKLEIFPEINQMIDKKLYNNFSDNIKKVEYVVELYKSKREIQDFLKEPKNSKITFLDKEILAFVYVTKMEIEEWEKFEIEKRKYNTACKAIFFGEDRDYAMLIDGYGEKIERFRAKNKEQLDIIQGKDEKKQRKENEEIIECYQNKGIRKIKFEICEACALYCSHYQRNCDLEDEYYEEREMEHQIREEKEFIARIKEELMKYEVSTRNNVIRNLNFISSYIDEKMFLLINNYGNLNEQGQKEYLLFIDCLMQQLDKEYSYQSFCEKEEKIIDIKEVDILLERMSWQQLYTTLDIMLSSTLQIFSREDWYVFFSIGIVKMKYDESIMNQVYYGLNVFKVQQRYQNK